MVFKMKQNFRLQPDSPAQEVQDRIFINMSANQKLALTSQLWQLAKELANDKQSYDSRRPPRTLSSDRKNTR